MRNARAVIHSHGMESCPLTMLNPLAKEFRIKAYLKTTAVMVRNHGIYVRGDSWISARTQCECYHYLFDAAIKFHQLGIDWTMPIHALIQNAKVDIWMQHMTRQKLNRILSYYALKCNKTWKMVLVVLCIPSDDAGKWRCTYTRVAADWHRGFCLVTQNTEI